MITITTATTLIECIWFASERDMQVLIQDIYKAYKKCHKGKAKSSKAQQYDALLLDNLFNTYLVLQTNTYHPKPYTTFIDVKPNASTLLSSLFASYLGHFKHAKHYNIIQQKYSQFPWLRLFFYIQDTTYVSTSYHKLATKFSHQQYFFDTLFKDFIVIIQKGKSFITSSIHNEECSLRYLAQFIKKLQRNSQGHVFVSEVGYVHNRLKQRKIRQIFLPSTYNFYHNFTYTF